MKQIDRMLVNNRKPKRTKGGDKTLKGPRSHYQSHPIHGEKWQWLKQSKEYKFISDLTS